MTTLVADESVDHNLVLLLRNNGFAVISILENNPGITDAEVLEIAVKNESILLTEDKDFGELVIRFQLKHCGILLIRLEGLDKQEKNQLLIKNIRNHSDDLKHSFSVLSFDKLRIRKLNP